MTDTSEVARGTSKRAHLKGVAIAALLLCLGGCGNDEDGTANTAVNVIEVQVNALEDAAAVAGSNSAAELLNEQANQVKEIDETRKEVAAENR